MFLERCTAPGVSEQRNPRRVATFPSRYFVGRVFGMKLERSISVAPCASPKLHLAGIVDSPRPFKLDPMFVLIRSLLRLFLSPSDLREMALENLALRANNLPSSSGTVPRPRLRKADRLFRVCLSKTWKDWRRPPLRPGKPFSLYVTLRKVVGQGQTLPEGRGGTREIVSLHASPEGCPC